MSDNKNNTGYRNSGYRNSGDCNSGNHNSGDCNSGNYNSGNYNSGDCNSGYRNSGNYNSGDCNSGNYNSGNYNSGYRNSGNYNSGDCNSGYFNTDTPTVRLFNVDTGKTRKDINIPYICLPLSEWVVESKMSDKQKANDPNFRVKGGTLITRTYKEAWRVAWAGASRELQQQFLDLPNFSAEIFFEITGVDVRKVGTCEGKTVEIDGKKYRLVEA